MMQIGLYGDLGYETAFRLYREHEAELKRRFSRRFLSEFAALKPPGEGPCLNVLSRDLPVFVMPVGEGGLYGALWKACDEIGNRRKEKTGCRVDLLQVPVRQEVVEICELYEEDPYEVPSAGCFLVIWETRHLPDKDMPAWKAPGEGVYNKELLSILRESVIIGKLTNDGSRVLQWDDMVRYLTPPDRQGKDIQNRLTDVSETTDKEVYPC